MLPKNRKPTSPGKILLEEFLVPLSMTQTAFVNHLGGSWSQPKLSAILNDRKSITEAIALDLADALGTSPEFWMSLQTNINLWEASQKRKKIPKLHFPRIRRAPRKKVNS